MAPSMTVTAAFTGRTGDKWEHWLRHILRRGIGLLLLTFLAGLAGVLMSEADAQDKPQPAAGVQIAPEDLQPNVLNVVPRFGFSGHLGPLEREVANVDAFVNLLWPTLKSCDKTEVNGLFTALRTTIKRMDRLNPRSIPIFVNEPSSETPEIQLHNVVSWAEGILEWGKDNYNKYFDEFCVQKAKETPPAIETPPAKQTPPTDKDTGGKPGPDSGSKPGTDNEQQPDNAVAPHPLITTHMAKLRAAFKQIRDAIGQCDETAYERSVAEFKTLTDYSMKWHLSREDQQRHKVLLDSAIAEMRAMLTNIPAYPDPCEVDNVYYPELEFIAEQTVIAGTMIWPAYVCDMQKVREYYNTYFTIGPALEAMHAEAVALAVGTAQPGSEEYERKIKKGQLGRLIRILDTYVTNSEKYGLKKSQVEFMLTPGSHCPHAAAVNRARMPTVMKWLGARGLGNVIPNMRAMHKGKTAIPLPEPVRQAAIDAGLKIPPYAELPYDWR